MWGSMAIISAASAYDLLNRKVEYEHRDAIIMRELTKDPEINRKVHPLITKQAEEYGRLNPDYLLWAGALACAGIAVYSGLKKEE